MTPEQFYKENNIGEYKNHYPGLECPYCSKWGVMLEEDNKGECPHCGEAFCDDDICPECNRLVKGTCYSCKMD